MAGVLSTEGVNKLSRLLRQQLVEFESELESKSSLDHRQTLTALISVIDPA